MFGLNGKILAKGKIPDFAYENGLYIEADYSYEWAGLLIYLFGHGISLLLSLKFSGKSFKEWWENVGTYGSRKLVAHMMKLEKNERKKCKNFFEIYLSISLKYIVPIAIIFVTIRTLRRDIDVPYNGYSTGV